MKQIHSTVIFNRDLKQLVKRGKNIKKNTSNSEYAYKFLSYSNN